MPGWVIRRFKRHFGELVEKDQTFNGSKVIN